MQLKTLRCTGAIASDVMLSAAALPPPPLFSSVHCFSPILLQGLPICYTSALLPGQDQLSFYNSAFWGKVWGMHKGKSLFPHFPRTAGSHGHRARGLGSVPETSHGATSRGQGTAPSGLSKGCMWKQHSKTFRLLLS